MHIICGYVSSKTANSKDPHSWYATGISEIKHLLKEVPQAFQDEYLFIKDALTVSDEITSSTANEFEKSILVFITLITNYHIVLRESS